MYHVTKMNDYCFIVLFCTAAVLDAGTSEFVWLRDLNNDAQKRHLDLGLSEELKFLLNAEKKSINLHLKENPHIRADTDIYVIKEMPDGTKRAVKEPFTGNVQNKYYHDIDNGAVFTVRCSMRVKGPCARTLEGKLRIGDKYFHIAPVSDLSNVDTFYMNREYQDTPHVIREEMESGEDIRLTNDSIKLSDAKDDAVKKSFFANLRRSLDNLNVEESDFDYNKRATTVYGVELLVAVDPPLWQKFYALAKNDTQNAMKRVREYVAQVITGVAHIYKTIQGRSFSIDITVKAIAIVQNTADGPYKKAKPFKENGLWSIDDRDYLPEFANWVVNTPGIPSRSEIDNSIMLSGYRFKRSAGVAYVSSVCSNDGVCLVTEAGYFNTMMVASHELAHNLGSDEDREQGCPVGNIMGMNLPNLVNEYSHKSWEFSECSIASFAKTLSKKSCVKNKATFIEDYDSYNTLYPGQIYSAEEQCKIAFGLVSYRCSIPKPEKICVSLSCYNPTNGNCNSQVAADGTQCGTGNMWCIEGLCVSKSSGVTTPKPATTTVNGKKTPKPKSTTTTVKGAKSPSSTRAPSVNPPSCKDSDVCKQLYEIYNHKKRFCSDLGEVCCETCTGDSKCEDTGYMDLNCADLRSFYSSKSKFCSKWSGNCCKACSKTING